jgi:hypothetical protein
MNEWMNEWIGCLLNVIQINVNFLVVPLVMKITVVTLVWWSTVLSLPLFLYSWSLKRYENFLGCRVFSLSRQLCCHSRLRGWWCCRIIPCSRASVGELMVTQLVKKFVAFCLTRTLTTGITTTRHRSPFWLKLIQTSPSQRLPPTSFPLSLS